MSKFPSTILVKDGEVEVPTTTTLYDFFSPRTKSITVWSVGFQYGGLEAHIAESTGAKIHIFDCSKDAKERYEVYNRVLNSHETQPTDPEWANSLCNIWILPDSTEFHDYIPSSYTGSLKNDDVDVRLQEVKEERVDLCKIDCKEFTTFFLYEFLSQGYRPGLLYVHWPAHPDESSQTMAAAGHLQTLGYRLLRSAGNYFLYIFVDDCMYEICSWNDDKSNNPMFTEYRTELLEQLGVSLKKTEDSSK